MAAPEVPPLGSWRMRMMNAFTRAHVSLYRVTSGRVGGKVMGAPVLLLHHVGRKSGASRTTPLLYLADGENVVIVASRGGSPQHPAWWLNLRDRPETEVEVGGERRRVRAREATRDERARLWPRLVEMYPDYDEYTKRTDRELPVILLQPA